MNENNEVRNYSRRQRQVLLGFLKAFSNVFGELINDREFQIVIQLVIDEKTAAEVGKQFGLSATRVNHIAERTIRRLTRFIFHFLFNYQQQKLLIEELESKNHELTAKLTAIFHDPVFKLLNSDEKYHLGDTPSPEMKKILSLRLDEADFSPRITKALAQINIFCLADLVTCTKEKLMEIKGFGTKGLMEVQYNLKQYHLQLADAG